jgi:hypothetical protein
MADASTWPDDVRDDRSNGPWHYIDIPRGKHGGDLEAYCRPEGCLTRAIDEQRSILADKSAEPVKRAEALRYLIHLIGDLHQPLHTISNGDIGGTCVPVKYLDYDPVPSILHPEREDYSPNLHQIWDTEILERSMEISSPRRYADELDKRFLNLISVWKSKGIRITEWVWESHERAETDAYGAFSEKIEVERRANGRNCSDNNHLSKRMLQRHLTADEAYQSNGAKAVETSVAQAGIRLAMMLNEAAAVKATL